MATSTKTTDLYNEKVSSVVRDMIWKDHVSKIEKAQRVYDRKWGYLHDAPTQTPSDSSKRSRGIPHSNAHALSMSSRGHDYKQEQQHGDVTINPSPRPVPPTSNQLIGWRTADKNCTLEIYGKYARGQESLHRKFKWPVEGFD